MDRPCAAGARSARRIIAARPFQSKSVIAGEVYVKAAPETLAGISLAIASFGFVAPIAVPAILPSWNGPTSGFAIYFLPTILWLIVFALGVVLLKQRSLWLILGAPIVSFWLWFLLACARGQSCF